MTASGDGRVPPVWQPLAPRALTLRRVEVALVAVPLLLVCLAVALRSVPLAGGLAAVVLIAAAVALLLVRRRARAWGYAEREADLLVRRGLLVRRLSVVPYGRMQVVDVTSGPLSRRLGLASVELHTAAATSDAKVPALQTAEAERLRDRLAALGEARASGL